MSECEKQVQNLEDAIKELPKDTPTRLVWERSVYLLGGLCNTLEELRTTIKSDIRFLTTLLMIQNGYEHDPEGAMKELVQRYPQYADKLPSIHGEEGKKDATPERTWFINKVLPALVIALITGSFTVILTLVVLHIQELVP